MNFRMPSYMPLRFFAIYIVFGLLVSFSGPIIFLGYEKAKVGVYVSFFILLFSLGYWLGIKSFRYRPLTEAYETITQFKVLKWVKIMILIFTLSQIASLGIGFASGKLSISLSNVGEAYFSGYEDYERNTGNYSLTFLIDTAAYIPYLVTTILGVLYFKKLPTSFKLMVVFAYVSIIFIHTLNSGKQKQFADLLIILLLLYVINVSGKPKKIARNFSSTLLYVIGGAFGIGGLLYLLASRYEAIGIHAGNINDNIHPLMRIDFSHSLFTVFGEKIGLTIAQLSGYLSQGYYGLSLSMRETFEWTYFVGNSYSLTVFLNRFLGLPLDYRDTYPYRAALNTGWGETKWSSAFSWYAGDFTFTGTLFFYGFMAFLYSRVWIESVRFKNPISIVLFITLSIGLLYLPANNQLMHTPGSCFAIIFFLGAWVFRHNYFNFQTDRLVNRK